MSRTSIAISLVFSLVFCTVFVVIGDLLLSGPFGLTATTESSEYLLAASGGAIFLGILSSLVFDRFGKNFTTRKKLFRKSDLIIASIVSPLVFLSFYPLLKEANDPIIQGLMAYQNGFVFQNIIARVRGEDQKDG